MADTKVTSLPFERIDERVVEDEIALQALMHSRGAEVSYLGQCLLTLAALRVKEQSKDGMARTDACGFSDKRGVCGLPRSHEYHQEIPSEAYDAPEAENGIVGEALLHHDFVGEPIVQANDDLRGESLKTAQEHCDWLREFAERFPGNLSNRATRNKLFLVEASFAALCDAMAAMLSGKPREVRKVSEKDTAFGGEDIARNLELVADENDLAQMRSFLRAAAYWHRKQLDEIKRLRRYLERAANFVPTSSDLAHELLGVLQDG